MGLNADVFSELWYNFQFGHFSNQCAWYSKLVTEEVFEFSKV
jgi:hypothetical protein